MFLWIKYRFLVPSKEYAKCDLGGDFYKVQDYVKEAASNFSRFQPLTGNPVLWELSVPVFQ